MSKAFDTVNLHTLINKLSTTAIEHTTLKYIANYITGRKGFTQVNNTNSKQKISKQAYHKTESYHPHCSTYTVQIYLPSPPPNNKIISYADDIIKTITLQHKPFYHTTYKPYTHGPQKTNYNSMQQKALPLFSHLTRPNIAPSSTSKSIILIPTVRNPKILVLTFDPMLTFSTHISNTHNKANNTIKIIKSLTATQWGKQKNYSTTFQTITRPILEHANT